MGKEASAIEVKSITKRFGSLQALGGVDFSVPSESVFGILGPNGAGKTTLLRILTTITRADSGSVTIEGLSIQAHLLAVRQLIGVVAQENHFDRYLSIWHNLTLHAQMHGIPRPDYERRITELLERVGLFDRRHSLPDDLSGGMQRRIILIRALIHQPKILFLDEPTTGLDPQARLEIWETIELFKKTATVILTTHYMEEADRLADEILLLHQGKVMQRGTPRELKQSISPVNKYELILKIPDAKRYSNLLLASPQNGLAKATPLDDYRIELQLTSPEGLRDIMNRINPEDLMRLGQIEADLEDVFLSVAGSEHQKKGPQL